MARHLTVCPNSILVQNVIKIRQLFEMVCGQTSTWIPMQREKKTCLVIWKSRLLITCGETITCYPSTNKLHNLFWYRFISAYISRAERSWWMVQMMSHFRLWSFLFLLSLFTFSNYNRWSLDNVGVFPSTFPIQGLKTNDSTYYPVCGVNLKSCWLINEHSSLHLNIQHYVIMCFFQY